MATAKTSTTRSRTTKQPQDHQPSKEEKQLEFEELEGHELLKPITSMRPSEMARVQGKLISVISSDIGVDDLENVDVSSLDFDALADFIEFLEDRYVLDGDAWDTFGHEHGMEAVQSLAMGYGSAMGKGSRSTNG